MTSYADADKDKNCTYIIKDCSWISLVEEQYAVNVKKCADYAHFSP